MNFLSYGLTKYLILKYLSGLTPTIKMNELLTTDFRVIHSFLFVDRSFEIFK